MSKLSRQLMRGLRDVVNTEYRKRTGKRDWKYELSELRDAAMDTLVYSWWTPVTVFFECWQRVIKWFPIIWKDRHWDHGFILEILKHKIRFTRECIGKYDRHTTAKEDCKNMRIAEILIDRLQKSEYAEKDWEEHYARWPSRFLKMLEDGGTTMEKPTEEECADVRRIGKREAYMKSQDYDYLFKHLKKHLEKWWD